MLLEVGKITKPHGLRGEVIVKLSTNREERLAPGTILDTDGGQLTVVSSQPHQHGFLVRFAEISTREGAEGARGRVLRAEPIDDAGELWVHEVIGAEVVDTTGTALGRCVSVEANPASDLIVLDGGGLVPMRFVVEHEPGKLTVDGPDGLLDV